jgi:hypothetical protein
MVVNMFKLCDNYDGVEEISLLSYENEPDPGEIRYSFGDFLVVARNDQSSKVFHVSSGNSSKAIEISEQRDK